MDRLDLVRQTIRVDRQLITLPHQERFLAPPKTSASVRTVPLPESVAQVLELRIRLYADGRSGLLFTAESGGPIRRTAYSARVWRPAVQRAQLPKGTTFHDLRHFYASLLIVRRVASDATAEGIRRIA
jgi:integrase